jgi:hypothetical protein
MDDDLVDRADQPVREMFQLDVEQAQLIVRVEQVGQTVGVERDPAEDALMRSVRGKPDERGIGDGIGFEDLLRRALEDELEAARL